MCANKGWHRIVGWPGAHAYLACRGGTTVRAYSGHVAFSTQNRSQLYREARDRSNRQVTDRGHRLVAERKARTSVYRTTDGMTRELLRPVRD